MCCILFLSIQTILPSTNFMRQNPMFGKVASNIMYSPPTQVAKNNANMQRNVEKHHNFMHAQCSNRLHDVITIPRHRRVFWEIQTV